MGRYPGAVWRVLKAALLLARSRRLLARASLSDALTTLVASRGATSSGPPSDPRPAATAVERAARLVPGADCLPRSVSLAALLVADGHSPELVLGCRKRAGTGWLAHAWVEVDGRALERDHDPTFLRLARASQATSWRVEPWE